MREQKKQFGLFVDQSLYDAIRAAAEQERRSLGSYVRIQLERAVKQSAQASERKRGRDDDE